MSALTNKIHSNLHKVMAVPAIILFTIFFVFPLLRGIGLSLTDWDGVSTPDFVGLKNFIDFFHDTRALNDVHNTILFAAASAPLLNIFGLIYALILDMKFKGRNIVRVIIYLPAVISPLIMGYIWLFILQNEHGALYQILEKINLSFLYKDWLADRKAAMWVIIFINVWQYVGMTMTIYLAGLQAIPTEMYEASKIDGAGYLLTLRYITIPLLMPSIRINVITNIIGSLAIFDVVMALTQGGPGYSTETLSIFIMRMCYGSFTGYSTAVAIIMFFLILIPVLISLKLMNSIENA